MNTNTTEQTKTHKIKFTHGENGEVSTNCGRTVFSNLFMFGAFAHTTVYVKDENGFRKKYQTDVAGLKELASKADETIAILSNTVTALGEIMAWTEHGEIDTGTMAMYGWLIAGLGELIDQVAFESSEISYALKHINKQKQQNG